MSAESYKKEGGDLEDKKEYIAIWESYESYFEPYSDAEVGRLVRAMMKYKWSGAAPKFSGNERFVWPAIKRDMDAAAAKMASKAKTNSQNGAKGGRPKKADASGENPENPRLSEETQKSERFSEKPKKAIEKEKEKEKEKAMEMEKGEEDVCVEPASSSPPVISLPLNDGTGYPVSPEQCQEWAALYPAVDVMQELRKMVGWLQANSAKRKTRRGILRFVTNWLSREQDKGPRGSEWNPASSRAVQSSARTAMDDLRELHQMFGEEDDS